jgi:hypothetical protein
MCEIEMHDEWGLVPGDALRLRFEYTPRPVVLFAEPSSGPVDGGTTVVVVGEGQTERKRFFYSMTGVQETAHTHTLSHSHFSLPTSLS